MGIYSATGALKVTVNDTLNKGRYAADGSVRVTVVPGTAYTGLYAADGSMNVVIEDGFLYHPCGALRGKAALTTYTGLSSPFGALYMDGLTISFDPSQLFAAAEVGGWYDPSDLTTLFQDAAGTTPVTAVEQPVGLVLDKSKGLVLGVERIVNGGFDADSDWTKDGSWSISGGSASISGAGGTIRIYQSISTVSGATYRVTYTVTSMSGTGYSLFLGTDTPPSSVGVYRNTSGTFTEHFVASGTTTQIGIGTRGAGPTSVTIDNISVRELPGNHLSQSTAASRPVLSARVNLLTRTEQFDNAAWTKDGATVDPNAGVSPSGAMTADKLIEGTTVNGSNHRVYYNVGILTGTYTIVVLAKAAGRTKFHVRRPDGGDGDYVLFDLSAVSYTDYTGGVATASITSLDNGWYQCRVTAACVATAASFVHICLHADNENRAYTGDGVSGILLGGADLRVSNSGVGLPVYQRVGAATDYTTTGFPLYLKFDGTDDFLQSNTITPGSVDKVQVFAGVRKLSDAVAGVIAELSPTSQTGTFFITEDDTSYTFRSRGISSANATSSIFNAPSTDVLTAIGDISGDRATLRVNGTQVAQSTADQGTSNYLSYPLFIGSRNGTSIRFNGHLYSLILRFSAANLDAATITATETWVAGKTGIPIVASSGLIWDATADTYISNPYIEYGV